MGDEGKAVGIAQAPAALLSPIMRRFGDNDHAIAVFPQAEFKACATASAAWRYSPRSAVHPKQKRIDL
jgi:hypothetical protein